MDRAGLVGDDGPTHHGAFDISYLSCIPNIVLLAPRDTTEMREMVHFMAGFDSLPTAVRYPRGASDDSLPEGRTPIQLGKSELLKRGTDLSIFALGSMVSVAWNAAEELATQGVTAEVINARFVKPLDVDGLVTSAEKTGAWISIEENAQPGGFGEQVRRALAEAGLAALPHAVMALPDAFVEHGTQAIIRAESGLSSAALVEKALALIQLRASNLR